MGYGGFLLGPVLVGGLAEVLGLWATLGTIAVAGALIFALSLRLSAGDRSSAKTRAESWRRGRRSLPFGGAGEFRLGRLDLRVFDPSEEGPGVLCAVGIGERFEVGDACYRPVEEPR